MKFIISENRLKGVLEKFLQTVDFEEICAFFVMDENDELQVYLVISEDWYFGDGQVVITGRTEEVRRLKQRVKEMIRKMFGIEVGIYSMVRKCENL